MAQVVSSRVARLTVFLCSFLSFSVSFIKCLIYWNNSLCECETIHYAFKKQRDVVRRMWSYVTLWLARCANWLVFTDFLFQLSWMVFRLSLRIILVEWTVGRISYLHFIHNLLASSAKPKFKTILHWILFKSSMVEEPTTGQKKQKVITKR